MEGRNERFREKRKEVRFGNDQLNKSFDEWTAWQLVMGPKATRELTNRRQSIGFYGNIEGFEDRCGIYELAFGHKKDYLTVVYVGSTCRQKCFRVLARLREYCQHGDHKAELIDAKLALDFHIYFRARYVKTNKKVRKKALKAETAENDLLSRYNYAWNIRNNGALRDI